MLNSQFLLTGSSVLTVVFALGGAWPLLAVSFLIMLWGIWRADCEQIAELAPSTLAMFIENQRPLWLPEQFEGRELLRYQAGTPVYRVLISHDTIWELAGQEGDIPLEPGMIRVFPGLLYRSGQAGEDAQR